MTRTAVLQSFRTSDVPAWLQASMRSVSAWAASNGFEYRFLDDAFFDFAPDWVKQRCRGNIYAVTDLCRLEWLRRCLDEGFDRVVWADADVVVFDPARLVLDDGDHCFADEVFLRMFPDSTFQPVCSINNALMMFTRNQPVLDTYRDTCLTVLRDLPAGEVPRTALGPALLDDLAKRHPLRRIHGVGLFTPAILQHVAAGGSAITRACVHLPQRPPAAANLCHFLRNARAPADRPAFDRLYDVAVSKLLETHGAVLHGGANADPMDFKTMMRPAAQA